MKLNKFIEKLAQQTPSLLEQRKIYREVVDEFYRNNPEREIADRKRGLAEIALPAVLGSAIAAGSNQAARAAGSSNIKAKMLAGGLATLPIGVLINHLGSGGRHQKILKDKGLKTNLIGSHVKPLNRESKRKYFNEQ